MFHHCIRWGKSEIDNSQSLFYIQYMPRHKRLNFPGCIYHVITRGLERRDIFTDDYDRCEFINRLSLCLKDTSCQCLGWALIPNHFHLLIRTGKGPLTPLMRKLLTGYAIYFNKRHQRHGYLFQNRYKSVLCQEEPYLLELVRYIHLNPLRAGLVENIDNLDCYPWSGHSAIMGYQKREWQEVDELLGRFDKELAESRRIYREFIRQGIEAGSRDDLIRGSFKKDIKGWKSVIRLKPDGGIDRDYENILGDGDFIDSILKSYKEELDYKEELKQRGWDLERLVDEICNRLGVNPRDIKTRGRNNKLSLARQVISYFAYYELGISGTELSKYLNLSRPSLSVKIKKGKEYVKENGFKLIN